MAVAVGERGEAQETDAIKDRLNLGRGSGGEGLSFYRAGRKFTPRGYNQSLMTLRRKIP